MTSPIEHGLDEEQKTFIRKKVHQLGSISAVNQLYSGNCPVDEYARRTAKETCPNQNNFHKPTPFSNSEIKTKSKYENYCEWKQRKQAEISKLEIKKIGVKADIKRDSVKSLHYQSRPQKSYQKINLKDVNLKNQQQRMVKAQDIKDNTTNNEIERNTNIKEKSEREKQEEAALLRRRKENAEAALRMASRQSGRDKNYLGTSIAEYEEGTLRTEWGTREDHKKMRARDWGDMQKRRKE